MAKLDDGLEFTGSIGDLSVYNRRDVKQKIVRQKGGPSGEQIATLPSCAPLQRNSNEFGAISKAVSQVTNVLRPFDIIKNYNFNSELVRLMFPLKNMDTSSPHGQRGVCLSKAPHILNGFPLNDRNPFESVVRTRLSFSLSRELLSASVEIPALVPKFNFFPIGNFPVYRWIISFGLVPDIIFDHTSGFAPTESKSQVSPSVVHTEWLSVVEQAPLSIQNLSISYNPLGSSFSLMLVAALSFGMIRHGGEIIPAKYCGAGKVLAMA